MRGNHFSPFYYRLILLNFVLILIGNIGFVNLTRAQTENRGRQVMKKYYQRKQPRNSYSRAQMALIDPSGNRRIRKLEMYTRQTPEGEDTFIRVQAPADIKGMKFLTLAHESSDVQRLYMPAIDKVRRISGSGKEGRFLGSDIYYYDLEDHDLNDFSYTYLGEGTLDGRSCHVVKSTPAHEDAPYAYMKNWVGKEDHYVYKIEMYESGRTKPVKTMQVVETKTIKGIIITSKLVMANHRENRKTLFRRTDIRINTDIGEDIFTIEHLRK